MFDDILKMVKDHFSDNPEIAAAIPAGQEDAVHNAIAEHLVNNAVTPATGPVAATDTQQATTGLQGITGGLQGAASGLLGKLENNIASGGVVTSAIEGGLVSSLASKFGLPPSITGAISGALPGLLQKYFAHKAKAATPVL